MTRVILLLVIALVLSVQANQEIKDGSELLKKVNEIMNPETVQDKSKMIITTSKGDKREFVTLGFRKNHGEKSLMRYLSPVQVKGQATLMLNNADDIWAYFPRTKRVRKLAAHAKKQKIQGSDFSYEDMGSGDSWLKEFDAKITGQAEYEDQECYILELTPNENCTSHYSRIVMKVLKSNYYPVTVDYYHEEDKDLLYKTLVSYEVKPVQGIPTAFRAVMYNKLDHTQTEIQLLKVLYDVELSDALFTERELRK